MNRFCSALLCALLGTATASLADDAPLSVSIAAPLYGETRPISLHGRQPHFHVLLTNTSDAPLHFWREWCSWGYYALSFELTDEHGKTWIAHKKKTRWTYNFPDFWTLLPKDSLLIEVYFTDKDRWEGFLSRPTHLTMRAICEVRPDDESRKLDVWSGRVASEPHKYVITD